MTKPPTKLFIIACFLILTSIACNFPILERIQSILPSNTGAGTDSVDPGSSAPSNTDGAELTLIPGATFQMGSATSDLLADEDEFPQHQITLTDFYIYTYEVTNQMYGACVDAGGCMGVESIDAGPTSHFEDPEYQEYPVVGVDWVMARNYCSWAGARLPTEAEWELASRGPDSLLYPWGEEDPTCDLVNMGGCAVPPDTQQVGHYLLGNSPDGVWDLSGNVWEWVHDWYADDYYSQSPSDNPIGPLDPQDPDKPLRVIRGGGLYSEPVRMRSAARLGLNPYRVFDDVGFRCVAGEGLALPAAYDRGEDWHERVPPDRADGGDRAEDDDDDVPGGACGTGPGHGTCPDAFDMIRVTWEAYCRNPSTTWSAFYDDWGEFDPSCISDEALGTVTCEGLAPPDYLTALPDTIRMHLCYSNAFWSHCFDNVPIVTPTDCGEDLSRLTAEVHPGCIDTDSPAAIIIRVDPPDAPFVSASTDAILLTCDPLPEDGFYLCPGLPGSPGDVIDIHISFSDGSSITETIEYPDCSVPFRIEPHCLEVEGVLTPSLILQFPGVEAAFVGATANGTDLICESLAAGIYACHGLTGVPGDALFVIATFDTGATLTDSTIFPSCDGPVDFGDPWALAEVGCQGESEYYAVLDTFITDEIASWSLEGVEPPLVCGPADPPRPGRFYCNFAIRDWYTELTFCVEIVGRPGEICETFDNDHFGALLPDTCSVPDDDDSMCSPYDQTECLSHPNECEWTNGACYDR